MARVFNYTGRHVHPNPNNRAWPSDAPSLLLATSLSAHCPLIRQVPRPTASQIQVRTNAIAGLRIGGMPLHEYPLAPALDELVHEEGQVRQRKTAYVKREELGRMPGGELKPHLRLVGMA